MDDFVRLMTEHQGRLFAYVFSLLGNPDAANDVLQEVNVVLWRDSREFRPGTNFKAWAFRVAHFQVMAWRQRQIRDRLVFEDDLLEVLATGARESDDLFDRRQERLTGCLEKLTPAHRGMIRRRYAEGTPLQSIAAEHGMTANAVMQALFRIRQRLMQCVARYAEGERLMSIPCEEIRPDLEELLGAMAEGRLDADGAKRLSRILKDHPDARQFYFDYCQMHALLQSAHGVLHAMENPARSRRRLAAWCAAAAALLVAAGAAFLLRPPAPIDASVSALTGSAYVVRDDRRLPLAELRGMRAGDRVVTPAGATTEVRFGDGSRVVLSEKSELRLRDDDRARVDFREGSAQFEITPQRPGRPFAVTTPQADVTVLGTSFDLVASSEETRLLTRSGRVRIGSVEVGPGERAAAAAAGVVRWVPFRDHDFTRLEKTPPTMETIFCESETHLSPERRIRPAPDRVRLAAGGLTFVQGPAPQARHGLVVLREKEEIGEDVLLEAEIAGGAPWSLGLSLSGDAFEGYRVIFAAMDEYPNGVAVDTISAHELMVLARDPRKIPYDREHTLRVERRGPRIRVWIDGQARIDTEVTQPLPEGRRRTFSMSNFGAPPKVKSLRVWKPAP